MNVINKFDNNDNYGIKVSLSIFKNKTNINPFLLRFLDNHVHMLSILSRLIEI